MAWVLGRPRTIHVEDCTITTPIDCDIPDNPSKQVPHIASTTDKPSAYSVQLFCYRLSLKAHEMLTSSANKYHLNDYTLVQSMHDEVVAMLDSLPPAVRPQNPDTSFDRQYSYLPKQRQGVASILQAFLMALHRPHMKEHGESRRAAIKAALDCLEAQQSLFELCGEQHYKIYTLLFYTVEQGIFLSASALTNQISDQTIMRYILIALQKAIARLALMQTRSAMAKSGQQILSACYQKLLPISGQSTGPLNLNLTLDGNNLNPSETNLNALPETVTGPADTQQISQLALDLDLFTQETFDFLTAIEQSSSSISTSTPDVDDTTLPF